MFDEKKILENFDLQSMYKRDLSVKYCSYVILNKRLNMAYVGVTNNLQRRISAHKIKTSNAYRLVQESDTEVRQLSDYIFDCFNAESEESRVHLMFANMGFKLLSSIYHSGNGVPSPNVEKLINRIKRRECIEAAAKSKSVDEFIEIYPLHAIQTNRRRWFKQVLSAIGQDHVKKRAKEIFDLPDYMFGFNYRGE